MDQPSRFVLLDYTLLEVDKDRSIFTFLNDTLTEKKYVKVNSAFFYCHLDCRKKKVKTYFYK